MRRTPAVVAASRTWAAPTRSRSAKPRRLRCAPGSTRLRRRAAPGRRLVVGDVALAPGHLMAPREPVGVGRRRRRGDHVVAGREQRRHQTRPDVPGRAEDHDPHQAPRSRWRTKLWANRSPWCDDCAHRRVHGGPGQPRERQVDGDRQVDAQVGAVAGLLQHVASLHAGLLVGARRGRARSRSVTARRRSSPR